MNAANFLNNSLSSSISYSKTFPGEPQVNMSLSATHSQNTNTQTINMTLPTLDFARNLGKGINNIKHATNEIKQEINNSKDTIDKNSDISNQVKSEIDKVKSEIDSVTGSVKRDL